MGKKILIISEFIAPVQSIGSIRWSKFAKYLAKEHGFEITVLTNQKCFDQSSLFRRPYRYDSSIAGDMKYFNTLHIKESMAQRFCNCIFNLGYKGLRAIKSRRVQKASENTASNSSEQGQKKTLLSRIVPAILSHSIPDRIYEAVDSLCGAAFVKAGLRSGIDFDDFDFMISSYSPIWCHDLAMQIKKRHPHVLWMADYRDAIIRSERSTNSRNRRLSEKFARCADIVSFVSDSRLERLCMPEGKAFLHLPNGYDNDEQDPLGMRTVPRFRLTYTGTIYNDSESRCDLSPLFRSLQELVDEGAIDAEDLEVDYAGNSSHLFIQTAGQYPSIPVVDHGLLPRAEALKLQQDSVALVLACWNTQYMRSGRTGKIYEYISRGLPIVALVTGEVPHAEMKTFIDQCELGVCYEEADPETHAQLKEYLRQLYLAWRGAGCQVQHGYSEKAIEAYSYSALADRLARALEELERAL